MNKKKKSNSSFFTVLITICSIILFYFLGMLMGKSIFLSSTESSKSFFIRYLILLFFLFFSFYIHIIIHEGGHLIFGLISGYSFESFRIGSVVFQKKDKGIKIKRMNLAGTGGQCLMSPPEYNDGNFPFKLYNLGGGIMNLIFAFIGFIVMLLTDNNTSPVISCIYIVSLLFMFMGIFTAFLNLIPISVSLPNDGKNTLLLSRDKLARKAFWVILHNHTAIAKGQKLSDLPDELFEIPENADTQNELISNYFVLRENRFIEKHDFSAAKEEIENLIENFKLPDVLKTFLLMDKVYIDLIEQNPDVNPSILNEKKNKVIISKMSKYPSVIRTQYAIEHLYQKNQEKAEKLLIQFEKIKKTYPYPSDIDTEQQLIDLAKNI